MKFLIVTDMELRETLLSSGYRQLQERFDIERRAVWTFEYDETKPLCFDINSASIRGKCKVQDRGTMCF